jgi:hypothetical protein
MSILFIRWMQQLERESNEREVEQEAVGEVGQPTLLS